MASKITIRIKTDKNGKQRAYYWGIAKRWLPIRYEVAMHKLEAGHAIRFEKDLCQISAQVRAEIGGYQ